VDGDPEWLAARLASVCLCLDFDGFVAAAVRLIPDDLQVTAVIRVLDRRAAGQQDEWAVSARRLRLAQYAGLWSARSATSAVLEVDPA
jgi:hypothetical protein